MKNITDVFTYFFEFGMTSDRHFLASDALISAFTSSHKEYLFYRSIMRYIHNDQLHLLDNFQVQWLNTNNFKI